jgi:predicted CoA-binding protein
MYGDFLKKGNIIALVGASRKPEKWGCKLFRQLRKEGFSVFPVNPNETQIDGEQCFPDISSLPEKPDVIITVVRPEVTEKVVKECKRLGIGRVWMQPGSESGKAVSFCRKSGIKVMQKACYVADGLK